MRRVRAAQGDQASTRADAMRRSRKARPVPGPGWVCRSGRLQRVLGAVFQGDEPERTGPRTPIRPSGNPTARITRAAAGITGAFKTILPPAASLPSSGPRANGRDLGLAQLQPGVVHWTASDQQGALWPRNFDVSLLLVPGACQALRSGVS